MRETKYNVDKAAEKRSFDGIVFDSELEMQFFRDVVRPMLDRGELKSCARQQEYILQPGFEYLGKKIKPIIYKADFVFLYPDGREVVIDTKGFADAGAKLKRKLFWHAFPELPYYWVGHSKLDGGWTTYEQIQAGRRARKRARKKEREEK